MTKRQADWAASHDWWRNTHQMGNGMYKVVVRSDTTMGIQYFEDFQELRNWAGY